MIRTTLRVSLLAAAALCARAGDPRLRIEPAQPSTGGVLSVVYDPKTGPIETAKSYTLVYGFQAFENRTAPLQAKDGKLTAAVAAPADAVYFWCWVQGDSAEARDTNRGGAWDTYLYDAAGMPLAGARAMRARMIGMRNQSLDPVTAQLILMEEELRAHPQDAQARAQWWTLRFQDAGRTNAAREAIVREIGLFYDSHMDQPWVYQAAALGYNHLDRNQQAIDVLREFARRFPNDTRCDNISLTLLMNYGTASDLEGLAASAPRWERSERYWGGLMLVYERTHADAEKLLAAGRKRIALLTVEQDPLAEERIRIAETWLANGVDPVEVERVARAAVAVSEVGPKLERPPNQEGSPRLNRHFILSIHRSTLGWALFREGRYEEALAELQRAAAILEKEDRPARSVYYRLGQALEKAGLPRDAEAAYIRELAFGDLEKPTRAALLDLYRVAHGSVDGAAESIDNRVNEVLLASADAGAQPIEEMHAKPGRFDLLGADGRAVQLSAYAGKAVLIDFWATWCGPCLKALEHSNRLAKQYGDRLVVLAVAVDSEETRPRAAKYLKEHGYNFTLLYDDPNRRELPVAGVPGRYLIDAKGVVRLHGEGWSAEQEVVFDQKLAGLMAEK